MVKTMMMVRHTLEPGQELVLTVALEEGNAIANEDAEVELEAELTDDKGVDLSDVVPESTVELGEDVVEPVFEVDENPLETTLGLSAVLIDEVEVVDRVEVDARQLIS